jgi:hypothetical protein
MAFIVALLLAIFAATADAQEINYETARDERKLQALEIDERIVIDGKLDEVSWSRAGVATDFIQNEPRPDQPASEQTEVRVLFDSENIYFGFLMKESRMEGLVINELDKDFNRESADTIDVILDTFHDGRNGYWFSTNAAGAKYDAQMINEGRAIDDDWDGIWRVKTSRNSDSWIAEMAIPFKTLKFQASDIQTWGINFHRKLRSNNRNEDSYWSPLPRIYGIERVSLAGTLENLEEIKPGANLKITPYVLGSLVKAGAGDIEKDADFGFDVKYGITTGFTWDFTYNTDFSQVEADVQQINLTRFSLFFPEKRDFFLENSGIFQFGAGSAFLMGSDMVLFFSRRIGLSDDGEAIPILGGTRLTGRAANWELGFINMQQKEFEDNRATNFTVARLRRNILANSDVGIMMTNKEVEGPHYNRVFGADANFRFGQAVSVNGYLAKSFSPLEGKDTKNLTSNLGFNYEDGTYTANVTYTDIQENFTNEMGFVPRTGIRKIWSYLAYDWRPEAVRTWIRSLRPHSPLTYIKDPDGNTETREIGYHLAIDFQNGSQIEAGSNAALEDIRQPFTISNANNIQVPIGAYEFRSYFIRGNSDQSRRLFGSGRFEVGDFYGGYKHTYTVGAGYRVNYKLKASFDYTHNNISLPQADGHFKTNLFATRFDYSFSTSIFLKALVQYNSDLRQWSSNVRFNIIHRPLSDFYLVYNEQRDQRTGALLERVLTAKFTYLLAK